VFSPILNQSPFAFHRTQYEDDTIVCQDYKKRGTEVATVNSLPGAIKSGSAKNYNRFPQEDWDMELVEIKRVCYLAF
jgi:hypothetical protein